MAHKSNTAEARFQSYLEALGRVIGHADRLEPLRSYLTGLLLPGKRKSVEPMAAKIDPFHICARHQSMHHFVSQSLWGENRVLSVARDVALAQLERHAPIGAWIVDDTGYPKKGRQSVGVARQYCGELGKQENCQVAVTVSAANAVMSVPCAYRLYLPERWASDDALRKKTGIPEDVKFQSKWEIALDQLRAIIAEDLPAAPVVADSWYGSVTSFREGITALELSYMASIAKDVSLWPPGADPLPPAPRKKRGRPPKLLRRDEQHRPVSAEALAMSLPKDSWETVRWREGTKGVMESRFSRIRVRAAHRDYWKSTLRPEEWFLVEWPPEESSPTKYWLSTVPENVDLRSMVRLAKLRWRIERDYQEMKDELGLNHYEGRNWRGFHHHGVLCIAAYAFLIAERARLSPPEPVAFLQAAPIPPTFRPRGAPMSSRTA